MTERNIYGPTWSPSFLAVHYHYTPLFATLNLLPLAFRYVYLLRLSSQRYFLRVLAFRHYFGYITSMNSVLHRCVIYINWLSVANGN